MNEARFLRANELMIGDWVKLWPPKGSMSLPTIFRIQDSMDLDFAECGRFEAIRLTSAVLDKFGFIEKHMRKRLQYMVGNSSFVIECVPPRNLSVYMNEEYAGSFEILYVHELQHLLKLLKIEKDIVL